MGYQYNAYPFEMTDHVVYILKKMLEAHDDWGYRSEPIYIFPFNDGFKPGRVKDANLAELFRYLENKKIAEIITSTDKDFYNWIKTPIAGMPKMRVNTRWKIKILRHDKLWSLVKVIDIRLREFNNTDIRCDLHLEENKLFLLVRKEPIELKRFNSREAKDVFARLIIQRVVERDADGYTKGKGVGSGLPIGPLHDVIRNAGFKKKARGYLFHQCTDNIIELKTPIFLEGEEINRILDDFVTHNSKNDKFQKSKNRETDIFNSGRKPFLPS